MPFDIIDLRSDTVTKPTPAMRCAMAEAEVGDDVYGEDPTINRLQERAAELVGKEAALFVPSGSMGNQTAVKVHTNPGEEVICEANCHIYEIETGTMAAFSGVLPRLVKGRNGIMDPDDVRVAVRPDHYYLPRTTLLCAENSHNLAGGMVMEVETARALGSTARDLDLASHLDGARIFNAAAYLGVEARELAAPFDSVMFCLSKGLCAPVGSLLAGSAAFVEEALKVRKMLGGGMRQAGILAAAGLVAFDEILPRLGEDHLKARRLAEAMADHPVLASDPATVQTNILMARVQPPRRADEVADRLKEMGILCHPLTADEIRFVTHFDVTMEDIEDAVERIGTLN